MENCPLPLTPSIGILLSFPIAFVEAAFAGQRPLWRCSAAGFPASVRNFHDEAWVTMAAISFRHIRN
jgi:hypothetical protein